MSCDFGKNYIAGVGQFLPNVCMVFDPFHLIQLANEKLEGGRASSQVNGQRLKSVRYALLKDPGKLTPG